VTVESRHHSFRIMLLFPGWHDDVAAGPETDWGRRLSSSLKAA
jgi:hypothetical protein